MATSRRVKGAGAYLYEQSPSGKITIVEGPSGVGVSFTKGAAWSAITAEIGAFPVAAISPTLDLSALVGAQPQVAPLSGPGALSPVSSNKEELISEEDGLFLDRMMKEQDADRAQAGRVCAEADIFDWLPKVSMALPEGMNAAPKSEQVDILLNAPWFSQFYYYQKGNQRCLTSPDGHGAKQPNKEKALSCLNDKDKALAEQYTGELLFEPGGTSCFKAVVSILKSRGVLPKGKYGAIQIAYGGDEEHIKNQKGKGDRTQINRDDKERLAEMGEATLEGLNYINAELEQAHPVMVGVTYKDGQYNLEQNNEEFKGQSRADHFVAIIGRKGDRYVFQDPGSQWKENRQEQHFVVDSDSLLVRDPNEVKKGGTPFEVTHVRKNR